MDNLKRLYIFTGKGGVGKTVSSVAFASYLKSQGKKVKYAYIASSSINSSELADAEVNLGDISKIPLEIKRSTQEYIGMKLKSTLVASLIVKAPFFRSLVSMIPGFAYLIFLGKIIYELREDPELHIIFDSPSSGHALTMVKAPQNFAKIFKTGILFNDAQELRSYLFKEKTQINIISIPTEMSCNEAVELKEQLMKAESELAIKIFLNNFIPPIDDASPLPSFLQEKMNNESSIRELFKEEITFSVPRSSALSTEDVAKDIVPFMKNLV